MIHSGSLIDALKANGLNFFVGVPDSLLKDFCAYLEDNAEANQHLIAANEGNAVAVAAGYHFATGDSAVVYLQNSGLGNIINPITSLAHTDVYKIPMLLIVGWRGEPGIPDEPQHIKQGQVTPAQLKILGIPFKIASPDLDHEALVTWVKETLAVTRAPVALLVKKGSFLAYESQSNNVGAARLSREQALSTLLDLVGDVALIATTGKTAREVFELRRAKGHTQADFLTVGAMGHASSIALGVAMGAPQKKIICVDGDGAILMHLGALPVIGSVRPDNFLHILMNNAAHESVGGQPTVADKIDFKALIYASGYRNYAVARTQEELHDTWRSLADKQGPSFLEIKISLGSRSDLGRPTNTPRENKLAFMRWLKEP